MRVAANLSWLFTEVAGSTLASRCVAAKQAGFLAVESAWPGITGVTAEDFKLALQGNGLTPVLINCYGGEYGS